MGNPVDRAHRARRATAQLEQAAKDEALQLGPSLVGALQGLGEEIREQRIVTERSLIVLENLTHAMNTLNSTSRGLADELSALRMQRSGGGNGHAKSLADDSHNNDEG